MRSAKIIKPVVSMHQSGNTTQMTDKLALYLIQRPSSKKVAIGLVGLEHKNEFESIQFVLDECSETMV